MSYRKPGETFTYEGRTFIVRKGEYDWRKPIMCDERCAFYKRKTTCRAIIKITGDCQPRYRRDNIPVYFEVYGQESK